MDRVTMAKILLLSAITLLVNCSSSQFGGTGGRTTAASQSASGEGSPNDLNSRGKSSSDDGDDADDSDEGDNDSDSGSHDEVTDGHSDGNDDVDGSDDTGEGDDDVGGDDGDAEKPKPGEIELSDSEVDRKFSLFYVGIEDRKRDPDPAPYGDFWMCFRGRVGQKSGKLLSLKDQEITFDLGKASGCSGYVFDMASAERAISEAINGEHALKTLKLKFKKGEEIKASIRITGSGGGCDSGDTRVIGGAYTAIVPGGHGSCR